MHAGKGVSLNPLPPYAMRPAAKSRTRAASSTPIVKKAAGAWPASIHLKAAPDDDSGAAGRVMTLGGSPGVGGIAFHNGDGIADQPQCLSRRNQRCGERLAAEQPVQQIEEVGLIRNAGVQRHADSAQHRLLIMMRDWARI